MAKRFASRRYLGLVLSGAKNPKTTLTTLEYFPKEKKAFLLDVFSKLGSDENLSADQVLLDLIEECRDGLRSLTVNVPLSLPPCIECSRKACATDFCSHPSVKWMRQQLSRTGTKKSKAKLRDLTPYTQRPADIWIQGLIEKQLSPKVRFEIDETLGGARAPLTARMHFLSRHLRDVRLIETNPKLVVALLGAEARVPMRYLAGYRQLQDGAYARGAILERITQKLGIFVYERDANRLAKDINSFDAFFCSLMGYLDDQNLSQDPPKGFPKGAGWVSYPA